MHTDPIKLVQNILNPNTATPAPTTKPAEAAKTGSANTQAADAAKAKEATAAKAATNAADAYKLSQSLQKKLSQDNTSATPQTPDLSTYTAQGLKDYFQSAHDTQTKAKAAAAAAPKPLDDVIKAAQDIVKEKKATATDAALATVDSRLAQTVGISRVIGTN